MTGSSSEAKRGNNALVADVDRWAGTASEEQKDFSADNGDRRWTGSAGEVQRRVNAMVERDHEQWTGTRSQVKREAEFVCNALMASGL